MSFAQRLVVANGFNTQPPEGGCLNIHIAPLIMTLFQHTAARRRLQPLVFGNITSSIVSTHSRSKAAATDLILVQAAGLVSTHSRPKAAAKR